MGYKKKSRNSLYCNIQSIVVVWNQIPSISRYTCIQLIINKYSKHRTIGLKIKEKTNVKTDSYSTNTLELVGKNLKKAIINLVLKIGENDGKDIWKTNRYRDYLNLYEELIKFLELEAKISESKSTRYEFNSRLDTTKEKINELESRSRTY